MTPERFSLGRLEKHTLAHKAFLRPPNHNGRPPFPAACRVIVITEEPTFLVHTSFMEHRGVRYEIRIGIAREQWRVAIHPPGNRLPKERTVFGTRDALTAARSMINAWLKKHSG
jgi:hypothetical protein